MFLHEPDFVRKIMLNQIHNIRGITFYLLSHFESPKHKCYDNKNLSFIYVCLIDCNNLY